MNTSSFTDEQLLNLVNNKIHKDSKYPLSDLTGGGVQITSVYSNQITKYKVYFTFGYDEKKNSKTYNFEVKEDTFFLWARAIALKMKTIQILNSEGSLNEINELINHKTEKKLKTSILDNKIEIEDNKIEDRDRDRVVTTSLRTPYEVNIPLKVKEWIDYRRAIKKTLKKPTIKKLIEEHNNNPDEFALKVEHSIKQGYQGLYAPKENKKNNIVDINKQHLDDAIKMYEERNQ